MDNFSDNVMQILECPVCFNVPRVIPIASCSFGHIGKFPLIQLITFLIKILYILSVCENCRPRVIHCPVCRGCLHYNQNTVAGQICLIADYKCKYQNQGCPVKKRIQEIDAHERKCPERLIQCPFRQILIRSVSLT